MKQAFLIPVGDGLVRDPISKVPLPESGALMPLTTYWKRRLKFGEVVIGTPPSEKTSTVKVEKKSPVKIAEDKKTIERKEEE